MQCPFCNYRRKKQDYTPHWQCPKCDKAYNKFQAKTLNKDVDHDYNITDKERIQDFITTFFSNAGILLKIAFAVILLFFGIEEFLTEGVYYISNYYGYYKDFLGNDLFNFSVLISFLLFIIGTVIFIGRKIVSKN